MGLGVDKGRCAAVQDYVFMPHVYGNMDTPVTGAVTCAALHTVTYAQPHI